jgi:hypothetical protein
MDDEIVERARNEPKHAEPLRVENDGAAQSWLCGYRDGYQGHDLHTPDKHIEQYLRGFVAGMQAQRAQ